LFSATTNPRVGLWLSFGGTTGTGGGQQRLVARGILAPAQEMLLRLDYLANQLCPSGYFALGDIEFVVEGTGNAIEGTTAKNMWISTSLSITDWEKCPFPPKPFRGCRRMSVIPIEDEPQGDDLVYLLTLLLPVFYIVRKKLK